MISKENKKIIFFVLKFFLIFIILFGIISILDLSFLNNFLAKYSAKVVGLTYLENVVFFKEFSFIVTNFCTGLVSVAILFSIIFSFKKPSLKNKVIIFVLGFLILFIFNFFRIVFVLLMAKNGFDAELVHSLTWFLMSFLIIVYWFFINKKALGYKKLNELLV